MYGYSYQRNEKLSDVQAEEERRRATRATQA